jgi:RNA polymerase sigma-70 factor (ECF subfamily)
MEGIIYQYDNIKTINLNEYELIVKIDEKLDLYNAVDLLKNNYKTIIIMKYFNDLTIKEIGYTLNLSENTVKTNLKRAKEALFKILKEGYLND